MSYFLLLSFIVYALVLCFISFLSQKNNSPDQSNDADLIGNRSISYWITALSAHASDMSDWLFLAFPALIYTQGGAGLLVAIALIFGMFLTWQFIATPLRRKSEELQAISLIDYLESSFKLTNNGLRILSACITLFFFTIYIAAGIKGIGMIGERAFDLSYHQSAFLGSGLIVLIALIGGFVAAAWTDCFQALFLLGVVLCVPLTLYFYTDTYSFLPVHALERSITLSPFIFPKWNVLFNYLAWGLGYFGMPHILTKFLGTKNADDLYKAKYIGIAWQICALSGAAAIGFLAIGYVSPQSTQAAEQIFISMVMNSFHPFIAGLMLCGVLAATMSTILAQLLLTATTLTHDIYHRLISPEAAPKTIHRLYQGSLIFFIFFSYCIASQKETSIFSLVNYAWSGLGSSFGPLIIASLLPLRFTPSGALAGMCAGALGSGVWRLLSGDLLWFGFSINEMIPGYLLAFIALFIVSSLTKKRV
jgi:SSS family solute:Na+ symporter